MFIATVLEGCFCVVLREMAARDIGISMTMLLALSFIPSAFMVYLINEKRSQQRHLQAISGVGNVLYWTASFFWDLVFFCSCEHATYNIMSVCL